MRYACIASIPERENMLHKTIGSLRGQVDGVRVALNGYDHKPKFLNEGEYVFLDNSMGDAGKFYFDSLEGIIFTCDDDLFYPPNYCDYMESGIKKYKCAVTLHGKTYPRPIKSFREVIGNYRCLDTVDSDGRVDVGGTGVMAYDTDMLKVRFTDFKSKNMADLWFAKLCWDQGVRIMCLAHTKGNIGYMRPKTTIWEEEKAKGFKEQTNILKSFLK